MATGQRQTQATERGGSGRLFGPRSTVVTAGGGPLKGLGYVPPRFLALTFEQKQQYLRLLNKGLNPDAALRAVETGSIGAGEIAAGASAGLIAGAAAGAPFGALGAIPGGIIGGTVGALAGLFGGGGSSGPSPSEVPGRPPIHVTPKRSEPVHPIRSQNFDAQRAADGLKPNFRVVRVPDAVVQEIPQVGTPQATGSNAVVLPRSGLVPRFASMQAPALNSIAHQAGVVELGEALINLSAGRPLTLPQFGALAGSAISLLIGPEAVPAGAVIGAVSGQIVQELDNLAQHFYGKTLDQILRVPPASLMPGVQNFLNEPQAPDLEAQQGQDFSELQQLERELNRQPGGGGGRPIEIPQHQPQGGGGGGRPIEIPQHQPQGGGGGGRPIEIQPRTPQEPLQRPGDVPALNNQNDCTTPDSTLGELARALWNCPTFQQEMKDKITVVQKPGQRPQIVIKEPVCLCCDSDEDLQAFSQSGGVTGNCVQVRGAPAEVVGLNPSSQNPGLPE